MSVSDDVVALIDKDELVRFALEICNIDSAVGHEGEVGEHLYNWMRQQGFGPRKIGLLSDRFNVLGTLPGTGGGYSLIFNSHMDTAVPREPDLVHADPTRAVYHSAWQEDDLLVGEGICNDKGPMAAFLIAAKAIKNSGHRLKGDLLVSAAVMETAGEPHDEPPGTFVEFEGHRRAISDHARRRGRLCAGRRRHRLWAGVGRGGRVLVQAHAAFRSAAVLHALSARADGAGGKPEHDRRGGGRDRSHRAMGGRISEAQRLSLTRRHRRSQGADRRHPGRERATAHSRTPALPPLHRRALGAGPGTRWRPRPNSARW